MAPDAAGRIDAVALRAVEGGRLDDLLGDDLVLQDFLVVVNVVDELVEGVDALLESALNPFPLLGADDAGNQVEGENALSAGGIAIDVKGDAHLQQDGFRDALAAQKFAVFERMDGLQQQPRFRPRDALDVKHLVIETLRLIRGELHASLPGNSRLAD